PCSLPLSGQGYWILAPGSNLRSPSTSASRFTSELEFVGQSPKSRGYQRVFLGLEGNLTRLTSARPRRRCTSKDKPAGGGLITVKVSELRVTRRSRTSS